MPNVVNSPHWWSIQESSRYSVRDTGNTHRAGGCQACPRVVVGLTRNAKVNQPGTVMEHGGPLRNGLKLNRILPYLEAELVLLSVAAHSPIVS